jgi:hypothetical protein
LLGVQTNKTRHVEAFVWAHLITAGWLARSLLLRRCVSDLGSLPSPPHQLQQKDKLDSNNRKWQVASLSPAHKTLSTVLASSSACRCRKMMAGCSSCMIITQVPCSCSHASRVFPLSCTSRQSFGSSSHPLVLCCANWYPALAVDLATGQAATGIA